MGQISQENRFGICRTFFIRNLQVPSRFFLAPINTGFSKNGVPNQRLIKFHKDRSGRGIGISYVGNVAIGEEFVSNNKTIIIQKKSFLFKKLASVISENGSVPGIQLACSISAVSAQREWINKNRDKYIERVRQEIVSFKTHDFENIIQKFVEGTIIARKHGFLVIQIHAAHGYLLSQLMNPFLNRRKDKFSSRSIYIIEKIVRNIRKHLSDIILDIRLNLYDDLEDKKKEIQHKLNIVDKIVNLDIDLFSLSQGSYNINKFLIYPSIEEGHCFNLKEAKAFAIKYKQKYWNISGNIWDLNLLQMGVPYNLTFSIGRSLIADPFFIIKSLMNKQKDIFYCTRCHRCHYYSRGYEHFNCPLSKI